MAIDGAGVQIRSPLRLTSKLITRKIEAQKSYAAAAEKWGKIGETFLRYTNLIT